MRLRLAIEPIPQSTWGRSLAQLLPKKEWDKLRHQAYKEVDYKCEVCGEMTLPLHLHEQWSFEMKTSIQRLIGLEVCCELCHAVHHFGFSKETKTKAYVERLIRHWCKVNEKQPKDFRLHEAETFEINKKRANKYFVVKVGRRILV